MPVHTRTCGKIKVHEPHGTCGGITEAEYLAEDYTLVTVAVNVKRNKRVVHAYGPYTQTRCMAEKRDMERRHKDDGIPPDWTILISVCHLLRPEDWRPDGADPEIQGDAGVDHAPE